MGAVRRARRLRAVSRTRRLRGHVRARDPGGRSHVNAASPLRGRGVRAVGTGQHDHRGSGGRAELRVARGQPLRAAAQRRVPPLQRQRPARGPLRRRHRSAAGHERLPQRVVHLRQRRGLPRAFRRPAIQQGRGHAVATRARTPHLGDELRPGPAHARAPALGRARRRFEQHRVRPRRRHDARPHIRDAGRHLQEGAPARCRLPRVHGVRAGLQPVLV